MEYNQMKQEQAERLKKFRERDPELWRKILDQCTMCKSELICFDVFCAMIAVGNELRKEGLRKCQ